MEKREEKEKDKREKERERAKGSATPRASETAGMELEYHSGGLKERWGR